MPKKSKIHADKKHAGHQHTEHAKKPHKEEHPHAHHVHHHHEHHAHPEHHTETPESFMKRESNIEDHLIENMVKIQKVHTDLAEKFDKLAKEISNLLALFELAAKNFSVHPATKVGGENDKAFLEKIDRLLEQNKTIAKGLTLMEDSMRKKMYHPQPQNAAPGEETPAEEEQEFTPSIKTNRPLPRF